MVTGFIHGITVTEPDHVLDDAFNKPTITVVALTAAFAGYEGTMYRSTAAKQWYADGQPIEGQRGLTYTRTIDTVGKRLSQANSNFIEWDPPQIFRFSIDSEDEKSVTIQYDAADLARPWEAYVGNTDSDTLTISIPTAAVVTEDAASITIETDKL